MGKKFINIGKGHTYPGTKLPKTRGQAPKPQPKK